MCESLVKERKIQLEVKLKNYRENIRSLDSSLKSKRGIVLTVKAFEQLLLEAVDEALASLGGSAKEAIYFHLENRFDISRTEIPQSLEGFLEGLDKIFGVGAQFLEILMMKELYKRIGKPLEWDESKEFMFSEYVAAARRSFIESMKER